MTFKVGDKAVVNGIKEEDALEWKDCMDSMIGKVVEIAEVDPYDKTVQLKGDFEAGIMPFWMQENWLSKIYSSKEEEKKDDEDFIDNSHSITISEGQITATMLNLVLERGAIRELVSADPTLALILPIVAIELEKVLFKEEKEDKDAR